MDGFGEAPTVVQGFRKEVPVTDDGQAPLTQWVALYDELREAERLLAEADAGAAPPLRAEVQRLEREVDEALGEVRKVLEAGRQRRE